MMTAVEVILDREELNPGTGDMSFMALKYMNA